MQLIETKRNLPQSTLSFIEKNIR